MGREVRRVPADWVHPMENGRYKPMYPGKDYQPSADEWLAAFRSGGLQAAIENCGMPPDVEDYMPYWPESDCTHYMMYEDTSEGTPISPAFATPEELARWLADNGASSFGSSTATYEQWLPTCRGAWAPSMVVTDGKILSGVEFAAMSLTQEPSK